MGSLGVPLGSFWLVSGTLGAPIGAHLAALGVPWGEGLKFDDFGTPPGLLLGPHFYENLELFRSLNLYFFLMAFSLIFGAFWIIFWAIFCMQKWPYGGKGDFVKISVSRTR